MHHSRPCGDSKRCEHALTHALHLTAGAASRCTCSIVIRQAISSGRKPAQSSRTPFRKSCLRLPTARRRITMQVGMIVPYRQLNPLGDRVQPPHPSQHRHPTRDTPTRLMHRRSSTSDQAAPPSPSRNTIPQNRRSHSQIAHPPAFSRQCPLSRSTNLATLSAHHRYSPYSPYSLRSRSRQLTLKSKKASDASKQAPKPLH